MKDVPTAYTFWLAPEKIMLISSINFPKWVYFSLILPEVHHNPAAPYNLNGFNDLRNSIMFLIVDVVLVSAQCYYLFIFSLLLP